MILAIALALPLAAPPAPLLPILQGPWVELKTDIVAPDAKLGMGLALQGDTVLVGAPHRANPHSPGLFNPAKMDAAGRVFAFGPGPTGWAITQELVPSVSGSADIFGVVIEMQGEFAYIGAPGAVIGGVRSGAVFVFERQAESWSETQILLPSRPKNSADSATRWP